MRRRFFYGYVILALCFANMVAMRGVNGAFGVYYLALLDEFHWSRSDAARDAVAESLIVRASAPGLACRSADACAAACRRFGARSVRVVTLARAVR